MGQLDKPQLTNTRVTCSIDIFIIDLEYEQTEDIGFSDMITEKQRKKAYQVDFSVLPLSDIVAAQASASSHVAGILGMTQDQAAALLRNFKWNKERLVERYMDHAQEILDKSGVVLNDVHTPQVKRPRGFVCMICFDDSSAGPAFGLRCGHVFCQPCYEHYLRQKIVEEGECRRILCPETGCDVVVDEPTIKKVVPAAVMSK